MKGVVIGFLFCLLPVSSFAGFGLPWFHTRPKPVLFDEPPAVSRPAAPRPAARPAVERRDAAYDRDTRESGEPYKAPTPPSAARAHSAKPAR